MEHPFLASVDLDSLSLDELQSKLSDLTSKLTWAGRMRNSALQHQLTMVMESYRNAYRRKLDEQLSKSGINSNTINIK